MGIKVKLICRKFRKCGDKIRAFIVKAHRVLKLVFVEILYFDTKFKEVLKDSLQETLRKLERNKNDKTKTNTNR